MVQMTILLLFIILLVVKIESFVKKSFKSSIKLSIFNFKLQDSQNNNENQNINLNEDDVMSTLNEILKKLQSMNPNADSESDMDSVNIETLQGGFNELLDNLRNDKNMDGRKRNKMIVEMSLLQEDAKNDVNNIKELVNTAKDNEKITSNSYSSTLYSTNNEPYCVVTSDGLIGNQVKSMFESFSNSVDVKYLNGNMLNSLQDNEIRYAIRGCSTLLLACDNPDLYSNKQRGLFDKSPSPFTINSDSLKRLLNLVIEERQKQTIEARPSLRVVMLGRACRDKKGIADYLTGDSSDLEDELVLQCQRRGLGYVVVKAATVVNDNDFDSSSSSSSSSSGSSSSSIRVRGPSAQQVISEDDIQVDVAAGLARRLPARPFTVEYRSVQPTERTKVSTIAEALLRAASFPTNNCTYSILSLPSTTDSTTDSSGSSSSSSSLDDVWADELMKADGPELLRIPLRYASIHAVKAKIGRLALDLASNENVYGLITRVTIEKYSNGAKLLFQPMSTTPSWEEEKEEEKKKDEKSSFSSSSSSLSQGKSGYISPEEEAKLEAMSMTTDTSPRIMSASEMAAKRRANAAANKNIKGKAKKSNDGGLEILVDDVPYPRVRVRRVAMNRDSIPKEESESIILQAVITVVRALEKDYRTLLKQQQQ